MTALSADQMDVMSMGVAMLASMSDWMALPGSGFVVQKLGLCFPRGLGWPPVTRAAG